MREERPIEAGIELVEGRAEGGVWRRDLRREALRERCILDAEASKGNQIGAEVVEIDRWMTELAAEGYSSSRATTNEQNVEVQCKVAKERQLECSRTQPAELNHSSASQASFATRPRPPSCSGRHKNAIGSTVPSTKLNKHVHSSPPKKRVSLQLNQLPNLRLLLLPPLRVLPLPFPRVLNRYAREQHRLRTRRDCREGRRLVEACRLLGGWFGVRGGGRDVGLRLGSVGLWRGVGLGREGGEGIGVRWGVGGWRGSVGI